MRLDDENIINMIKKRAKSNPTQWKGLNDNMKREIGNIHSRIVIRKTAIGISVFSLITLCAVLFLTVNYRLSETQVEQNLARVSTVAPVESTVQDKNLNWSSDTIDKLELEFDQALLKNKQGTVEYTENINVNPPSVDSRINELEIEISALMEQRFWNVK